MSKTQWNLLVKIFIFDYSNAITNWMPQSNSYYNIFGLLKYSETFSTVKQLNRTFKNLLI